MAVPGQAAGDASIPVVIVDDARFTLEMLRRVLDGIGFTDVRIAESARQALAMLRERPAGILIADWLMPGMDGLELTRQVRETDAQTDHYTYVILLTARDGDDSLNEAFAGGVDDFISKSPDHQELLARIRAAGRIARLHNELLAAHRKLLALEGRTHDAAADASGPELGTRSDVEAHLDRLLRHTAARGGCVCVALVRIDDGAGTGADAGDTATATAIRTAAAERLRRTVRPLDRLGTVRRDTFAALMHLDDPGGCHPTTFRRVHEALNLRPYATERGFVSAGAAVALCCITAEAAAAAPAPTDVLDACAASLDEARAANRVVVARWPD